MKFEEALDIVSAEPLFETGLLLSGNVDPSDLRRQISRWKNSGRIHQLRRGLYVLAPPWRKQSPHSFLVANRLAPGSYVSGLSALAHAGTIPEYVPETTSVTSGRPQFRSTPLGQFSFRHLNNRLMFGYGLIDLGRGQSAFVAKPEKAILDIIHHHPGSDDKAYLEGLRLDFDTLQPERIESFAANAQSPKLMRAAQLLVKMAEDARSKEGA